MPRLAHETITDAAAAKAMTDPSNPPHAQHEDEDSAADRHQLRIALVNAYNGDTYRLLTDLAGLLGASVAYVDRPTVEAHLERPLSDPEWSSISSRYTAMAFDEHVGDAGSLRTDWIDAVLLRAGLADQIPEQSRPPAPPGNARWL